ncbi:hypothetical protein SNE40_000295 [Patella caerulea]|uniref:GON domain-containing protein n=1 Tax=Patella caerulea TaxID=87958 RepID=A0AAN8QGT1_PATCE
MAGRYELTLVGAIIILISYFNVDGNICVKPDPVLHRLQSGRKLNAQPFSVYNSNGLMDCYRQCGLYSLCRAINYNLLTLSCELISSDNSSVRVVSNGVVLDRAFMNPEMLGSCRDHDCPHNTRCEERGRDFTCVTVGCTGLPSTNFVNSSSFLIKPLWVIDETILYACEVGYYPSVNATCTSSGTFSAFVCKAFTACSHLAKCHKSVEAGEYWFHIKKMGGRVKSYCHSGSSPPFITLSGYNTASTPGYLPDPINGGCEVSPIDPTIYQQVGKTDYQKTRFRSSSGTLNIGGNSFSNTTQNYQRFGIAGDCYSGNITSGCPAIGYFIINTTGTGLRIKSSMQWRTWGVDGRIENITRLDDGLVIEGRCGGGVSEGNCGGCEPDGNPTLEFDPTYTPDFESATMPYCKALL